MEDPSIPAPIRPLLQAYLVAVESDLPGLLRAFYHHLAERGHDLAHFFARLTLHGLGHH